MKPIIVVFLLLLLVAATFEYFGETPWVVQSDGLVGIIVDENTKEPLPGVIVLAEWKPRYVFLGQAGFGNSLHTEDTVTDAQGKFKIAGWGPRYRYPFSYFEGWAPRLRIFKSGFYPRVLINEHQNGPDAKLNILNSEWNNKSIDLKKFDGDWHKYAEVGLGSFFDRLGDCFRECPRMINALIAEQNRIAAMTLPEHYSPMINTLNFTEFDKTFLARFENENK